MCVWGGQSLHFQSKQLRGGEQREAEGRKAGGGVEVGSWEPSEEEATHGPHILKVLS